MIITLFGRIPSKKNSKDIVCLGRTPKLFPSQKHKEWHLDASWQLKLIQKDLPKQPLKEGEIESVVFTYYPPDRIKGDLSNKWQSIEDLFKDCRIIEDDNWFVLGDLRLVFGGVDKANARAEIQINLK